MLCPRLVVLSRLCVNSSLFFNLVAKQPEGTAPQFTEPLEPVEVKEGSPANLQCTVTAEPQPNIEWFKGGAKVKESRRIKAERDGTTVRLSFKDTLSSDNAEYKCVATNDIGSASCSTHLTVKVLSKPDFKDKMKGVEVVEGDAATFEVRVVGYPEPNVEWFRGTTKLTNDGRFEIKENKEADRFSVVIGDVQREDAGMYKCVASNEVGKNTCRADLSVKERLFAPEFSEDQLEAPITATIGDEVSLDVTINGKPRPDVRWYKDDRILRESNRLDIKARGDKHSVVILGIKPEDSGVYKCEAKSKMGTVTRPFDVRVAGIY